MKSSRSIAKSEQLNYMPQEVDYSTYPKDFEETIKLDLPKTFVGVDRLPTGSVTLGNFLGKGAFGQVYRGEWNNRSVAMKEINIALAQQKLKLNEEEVMEALEWEISRLSTVSHPNIVQFYGLYEENEKIFLIMEFCEGGNLDKVLRQNLPNIPWSVRWQWGLEISKGLAYLHHQGVLHRDLKAENVLLDKHQRALLADLGVAQVDALLQMNEAEIITKGFQDQKFISPEGLRSGGKSTFSDDIYALGLVFWQLTTGKSPRKPKDVGLANWQIGRPEGHEREPIPSDCPEEFKKLILDCWELDPDKRPTAEHLVERLSGMASQFHTDAGLVATCEQIEELIHHQRLEVLKYIEPFLTEYELRESAESFWEQEENKANPSPLLQLNDTFEEFLTNPASLTLLLLGEAGLGKTLSTYQLAGRLMAEWWQYLSNPTENETPYLPVLVRPSLTTWSYEDLNNALLKALSSKPYKAISNNANAKLLVIVDGYDECKTTGSYQNLAEQLGIVAFPNAKLLVTCRVDAVERADLKNRFNLNNNLKVRYFLPFNIHQLLNYLKCNLYWNDNAYQYYQQKFSHYRELRAVLRNPFVLSLFARSWQTMCHKDFEKINRFQVYEGFVEHWLNAKKSLIPEQTQTTLIATYSNLIESFRAFAADFAFTCFRKESTAELSSPWMALQQLIIENAQQLFKERQKNLNSVNKLRALLTMQNFIDIMLNRLQQFLLSTPLKARNQVEQYEFNHKSFFEYFIAKRILHLSQLSFENAVKEGLLLLNNRAIQEEPEALIFVREGKPTQGLKDILFKIVNNSKQDNSIVQSSANAITILNAANVSFSGMDLSGINIAGAELSQGIFDSTDFESANLTGVSFKGSYLRNCNFKNSQMTKVKFGEQSYIRRFAKITTCFYTNDYLILGKEGINCDLTVELISNSLNSSHHFQPSISIKAIAISNDQQMLAVGGRNLVYSTSSGVILYKIKTYEELTTLIDSTNSEICSIAFSVDNQYLASGHLNGYISLWNISNYELKATFNQNSGTVNSLIFLMGSHLISCSNDEMMHIWLKIESEIKLKKTLKLTTPIKTVTISPDRQIIAVACLNNNIYLFNSQNYQFKNRIKTLSAINSLAFNSTEFKSQQLAVGSKNSIIYLYEITTGELITTFEGHTDEVNSVSFKHDGTQLISASNDCTLRIWNLQLFIKKAMYRHYEEIKRLEITLDPLNIIAKSDKQISVWDIYGQLIKTEPGQPLTFSTTIINLELIATSNLGIIYLYNTSNQLKQILKGHNKDISALAFSLHNEFLASSCKDRIIKIWNLKELKLETTLKTSYIITSIAWAYDNQNFHLITGNKQGDISFFIFNNNKLQLLWISSQSILNTEKANITNVRDLSDYNLKLLKLLGVIGSPIFIPKYPYGLDYPVHIAAAKGDFSNLNQLLNKNNINQTDYINRTPLYFSAQNGHIDIVNLLIRKKADINMPYILDTTTPLHIASENGHLDVVKSLIAAKANINALNYQNATPFYLACTEGHFEIMELLIATGTDVNIFGNQFGPLLNMASGKNDVELVKFLITGHADINKHGILKQTPLNIASRIGHIEVADLLIAAGADTKALDSSGETSLYVACQAGNIEIVKTLIAAGAAINDPTDKGFFSLHIAAAEGHHEVVELLIAAGAGVDTASVEGVPPLHVAVCKGHYGVVALLIAAGAEVGGLTNNRLKTFNVSRKNQVILKLIVTQKLHNLSTALFPKRELQELFINLLKTDATFEQLIDFIIDNKGNINATEQDQITLLMMAAAIESYEATKRLIIAGIDKNKTDGHATVLHYACARGSLEILSLLLEQECSLDIPDSDGDYPELWAVEKDEIERLQKVLEFKRNGAYIVDINKIQGSTNKNLLESAEYYKATKCIAHLNQLITVREEQQIIKSDSFLTSSGGYPQLSEQISSLCLESETKIPAPVLFLQNLPTKSSTTSVGILLNDVATTLIAAEAEELDEAKQLELAIILSLKDDNVTNQSSVVNANDGMLPLNPAADSGHLGLATTLIEAEAEELDVAARFRKRLGPQSAI